MARKPVHVALRREDFLRCAQVFHDAMNKAQFDIGFKADDALAVLLYTAGAYLRARGWPFNPDARVREVLELVVRGHENKEQFGLLPTDEVLRAMEMMKKS